MTETEVTPTVRTYRKRETQRVTAVQINLDLVEGVMRYRKWGDAQTAKQGDWLVNNNGESYTVDAEVFANDYQETSVGQYMKTGKITAYQATVAGSVPTKEGKSHYAAGDYVINPGGNSYCIGPAKFEEMYELAE
jgi:hypothetical protein